MRLLGFIAAALTLLCLAMWAVHAHSERVLRQNVNGAAQAEAALPQRVLWVWERTEDLRTANPGTTALAVLQQTLRLGAAMVVVPRRQPLSQPISITRIAVVRIETENAFVGHRKDAALLENAAEQLRHVATEPGVAALQIDFDARKSERAFYHRLLATVRRRMPAGMPLEITALASWCSNDDWISDLPVNGAIPMFFRMEPDRRRTAPWSGPWRVTEPLCSRSVGVSTGEPWPPDAAGKRVYLFADHGWQRDIAWLNETNTQEMRR